MPFLLVARNHTLHLCPCISGVSGLKRLCCAQECPSWSAWWMISLCTRRTKRASSTIALSPNCWRTTGAEVVMVWDEKGWDWLSTSSHLFPFVFVSFRSHPAILKVPSELFYDGELEVCAKENSFCSWEPLPMQVMILLSAKSVHERLPYK